MLFQSHVFVFVFLPALLALYYAVVKHTAARQWVLIAGSLVFYGWWDVRFIPLLIGQIGATWLLALLQARTGSRAPLIAGIVLNLASLATFKYLDFILASLESSTGIVLPRAHIV